MLKAAPTPRAGRRRPPVPAAAPSSTRLVLALLAAVFVLKLAVMLQLKDHVLTQPDAGLDTTIYVALAQRVINGDTALGPGLYFVSPLYIYFLAAVLAAAHSLTAVRLLQIVLGTGAVALVHVAANEWFGRRAAWLAAALAALTGLFTFYESLLIQAALDPFLTAAAMACLALAFTRSHRRWYVLAGLVFGIQALNRPNIMIPAGGVALLLAVTRRWRPAAIFAAGLAVALAPATVRNIVVAGYWSPVSSQGGLNFYIGNSAEADGTYRTVPGITPNIAGQQEDARRVAERETGHALDDAGVSAYFYNLGFTWIRERPLAAATLFARKLSLVFSAAYIWLNYSYPFFAYDARTLLRVLFVGPWLLIPLGLVGLVIAAPPSKRLEYIIWGSFVPLYALAVAMFFVADRYTLPLLIPLCAAAGAALDALIGAVSVRRWTPVAIASVVFVVLLIWVNRPLRLDEGVGEERTRMAERLITLDRFDEAEQWAQRAEQASARPGILHFRLGQRLLVRGQPAAAITHFEHALRADPGQPEVEYALGRTLLDAQRPQEAIVHLRRALEAGVHMDSAGYDLVRALGATGDRAGAISVLQNVRPSQPSDAEGWFALGQLGMQLREPGLADAFFRQAIAARADFAPAHLGLAAADASMGRLTDARLHALEALRLNPKDERAAQLLRALK